MAEIQTERQKALARELIENTKRAKPLNKKELVAKVGYSELSASHKQKEIIESPGVQKEIQPIVEQMKKERTRAIMAMAGKIEKAKYRDLNDAVDKLTKNIELLTGGATEREEHFLNEEQLNEILNRRTKEASTVGEI